MATITNFIDPKIIETYRKYKSSFHYFNGLLISINENKSRDLFSGCAALIKPLCDDTKENILSYINKPTHKQWEAIYSGQITPATTLWQAWTSNDSEAPRRKQRDGSWPCIPDGQILTKAIRETIKTESLRVTKKIFAIKARYETLEIQYPALKSNKLAQSNYLKNLGESDKKQVTGQILILSSFKR